LGGFWTSLLIGKIRTKRKNENMRIKWYEIEMKNWNKIKTWEHRNEEKKEAKDYNYENIKIEWMK